MDRVKVTLPPDCEMWDWDYWCPGLRQFDGKTVEVKRIDADGDYNVVGEDGKTWCLKRSWCHDLTKCQWLPWDPSLPKGDYMITGGEWSWCGHGDMGDMDFVAYSHWNGIVFVSDDAESYYYPTLYLANIPEVPK